MTSAHWTETDHAILTPAGRLFGVLSLPSALGWRTLDKLHPPLDFPLLRGPGAYYALVEPGTEVWPELAGHGVGMLAPGELVPLPPVPAVFGVWQWLSNPHHCHPSPRAGYQVQVATMATLDGPGSGVGARSARAGGGR